MANYLQVEDPAMPMHSQPNTNSKVAPIIAPLKVPSAH